MIQLKFAVVFALIFCATGSFPKAAKAQVGSYGSFSYPVPGGNTIYNYPTLDKPSSNTPSSNGNNTQASQDSSSAEDIYLRCTLKVKSRFGYNNGAPVSPNDPNFIEIFKAHKTECSDPFLSK
jgi:hypothetical protein